MNKVLMLKRDEVEVGDIIVAHRDAVTKIVAIEFAEGGRYLLIEDYYSEVGKWIPRKGKLSVSPVEGEDKMLAIREF